jgi:hypothetical protein
LIAGGLLAACGEAQAPGRAANQPATEAANTQPAPPAAAVADAPEPKTVADIFPAGPQREAVLNNCASCHNVACAAIGQRTAERWDALKAGHQDKTPGADVNAMFEYLKANFDSTKPEPRVPPRFLEGGCTPF